MLFLDVSHDVAIAAHLLHVFCFFVASLVYWCPSLYVQILQIILFKEKCSASSELNKGFAVSANRCTTAISFSLHFTVFTTFPLGAACWMPGKPQRVCDSSYKTADIS